MNSSTFGSRMMSYSGLGSPSNTAAMMRWFVVVPVAEDPVDLTARDSDEPSQEPVSRLLSPLTE
jgi:hypothetical protein